MKLTREQSAALRDEKRFLAFHLERAELNEAARSVPASLSSDMEGNRGWYREKLVHTADAIDLHRAIDGLPMLWNHDRNELIGVIRDLVIEGGKLRGTLVFARTAKAEEVFQLVQDGIARDMSIGYGWVRWEESADSDLITVTRWELFEASVVTVPFDQSVGVGRQLQYQGAEGADSQRALRMDKTDPNGSNVVNFEQTRTIALAEGRAEGMRLEAERRSGIEGLFLSPRFVGPGFDALKRAAFENMWSVDQARAELLNLIGNAGAGAVGGGGGYTQSESRYIGAPSAAGALPHVMAGEDSHDAWMRGAELAIAVRAGIEPDKAKQAEARSSEFAGFTLVDFARDYCRTRNVPLRGKNRDQVVATAFATRGVIAYASGDFTGLLENIANKSMLLGYSEAEELWPMIARAGTLPDFRQSSRPGMSEFDDLDIIRENGEYKLARPGDRTEKITLLTFGKLFRLGRQAIVNDDLGAFTQIPRKMGRAAKRAIGDQVFNVLTLNPTMGQDGIALFHASHNNLISAGSGAPSVAQLNTMKAAMGKQKDSSQVVNGLNIRLARIVVPLALEGIARTLATSMQDPATGVSAGTPNIHANTFEVVPDARLDTVSSTIWYGMADPNLHDVIEVAFLDGVQEPFLETQDGWTIDGVEYKVRIDCAAIPLEFRTMQRNNG